VIRRRLDWSGLRLLRLGRVCADRAHEWLEKFRAPQKRFVWFEHSAHEPMSEEPCKFTQSLIRYARPLAEAAGDVAPD